MSNALEPTAESSTCDSAQPSSKQNMDPGQSAAAERSPYLAAT